MTERASAALLEALALLRAPRAPRPGREQRLPQGILQLLRLAAGEEEAIGNAQEATRESASTLREAATFYIQQVLFGAGSSSFRVLGVEPDDSDERIREHYRWLARWLHPDRNPDAWEVVFADRVSRAWQDLRTPERRSRYQSLLLQQEEEWSAIPAAAPPPAPPLAAGGAYRVAIDAPATASRARRDLRWVPSAVLATLGVVAIGLVVLFYATPAQRPVALTHAESAALDQAERRAFDAEPIAPVDAATTTSVPATPVPAASAPVETASVQAEAPIAEPPPGSPAEDHRSPTPALGIETPAPRQPPPAAKPERVARDAARPPAPPRRAIAAERAFVQRSAPAPVTPADTASAAPSTPEIRPQPAATRLGARDADRLLNTLSRAYERGSLPEMRTLFAADAQGPRGGLKSILSDYNRVFDDSSTRSLAMRDVSWFESARPSPSWRVSKRR